MRTYINLLAAQTVLNEGAIQTKQGLINETIKLCRQLSHTVQLNTIIVISSDRRLMQNLIDVVWRENNGL